MHKPTPSEYAPFYQRYIEAIPHKNLFEAFAAQQPIIDQFFDQVSEEKSLFAYAEGKWSIRCMMQHIIDTERIFSYRALAFARGESQSLPGFDENNYADASDADRRPWAELCGELKTLRSSTIQLFAGLSEEMLLRQGVANGNPMTVRAAAYCIIGHLNHHIGILKERYL